MRRLRLALDVTIGQAGEAILREARHEIVTVANHGEPDRAWFDRALRGGAEVVISADADLEIMAYDHNLEIFKPRAGIKSERIAYDFLREAPKVIARIVRKKS